jgi:hypothetical protein
MTNEKIEYYKNLYGEYETIIIKTPKDITEFDPYCEHNNLVGAPFSFFPTQNMEFLPIKPDTEYQLVLFYGSGSCCAIEKEL